MKKLLDDFQRRPLQSAIVWTVYVGAALSLLVTRGSLVFFWVCVAGSVMLLAAAAFRARSRAMAAVFSLAAICLAVALGIFAGWLAAAYVGVTIVAVVGLSFLIRLLR